MTTKQNKPGDTIVTPAEVQQLIDRLERQMIDASRSLEFEKAAQLRDQVLELQSLALQDPQPEPKQPRKAERPAAQDLMPGPNKPNPEAVEAVAQRFLWWLNTQRKKPDGKSQGKARR